MHKELSKQTEIIDVAEEFVKEKESLENENKNLREDNDDILAIIDDFLEILLQITYVMIVEADNNQVGSFEEFLKSIEKMFDETKWVDEGIDLAVTPISGGNKTNPQQFTK